MKFSLKNGMSRQIFGNLSKKPVTLFLFGAVLLLSGCNFTMGDDMISSPNTVSPFEALVCPSCSVFQIGFNAGRNLCKILYKNSMTFSQNLLWLGFAMWLALHVMKFVSSLKEPDVAAFWNGMASRFGCALIASLALLPNLNYWVEMIFDTLLQISVNLSASVISQLPQFPLISPLECNRSTSLDSLVCLISGSSVRLMAGPMMMFADPGFWAGMILNPLTLVASCLVLIVNMIMVIGMPLFLLETVLEYFITLSLLPLWVVAWVFPITRDFASKAWEKIVPILFQIFGLCIFLAMASQIYGQLVKKIFKVTDLLNPLKVLTAPGLLIFISLFLYFFGKVLLQVINTVFQISGATGSTIQSMGGAVAGLAKKGLDTAEGKMDEAADQKSKEISDTKKKMDEQKKKMEEEKKKKEQEGKNGGDKKGGDQKGGDQKGGDQKNDSGSGNNGGGDTGSGDAGGGQQQ